LLSNIQLKKNYLDIVKYSDKYINYINSTKSNNSTNVSLVGIGIIYLIMSLFYNIIYGIYKFISSEFSVFFDNLKQNF